MSDGAWAKGVAIGRENMRSIAGVGSGEIGRESGLSACTRPSIADSLLLRFSLRAAADCSRREICRESHSRWLGVPTIGGVWSTSRCSSWRDVGEGVLLNENGESSLLCVAVLVGEMKPAM